MDKNLSINLPDGRRLAYAEFGASDGVPVMYFHGSPSCRLEPLMVGDDEWKRLGLRIIAPDRPGIGRSTLQPQRKFSYWPDDVLALADHLGLDKFSVLGNSGGGPYVAVCAAMIPEHISSAVIVSGGWKMYLPEAKQNVPFVNRLFLTLAGRIPPLCRLMLKAMGSSNIKESDRGRELKRLKRRVPPADFAAFSAAGRFEALHETMRECMHGGTAGPAYDLRLYMREFDFDPGKITIPVTMFHGMEDANSPIQLARRMASEIPTSRLITFDGEAHFSTLCNHMAEIADAIRVTS